MSRPRWYAGRDGVTGLVDLGEHTHRVSWAAGRLRLLDHDVAAEEVVRALGGEPCPCLVVRDMFRARLDVGPGRGGGWQRPVLGASGGGTQMVSQARAALLQYQSNLRVQRLSMQQRAVFMARLGLGGRGVPRELADVLAAIEDVRRSRRGGQPEPERPTRVAEVRLEAAVAPAIEQAMRHALPHMRASAPISVGCWKQVSGEPAVLQGNLTSRGGFVAVSLPVSWLNRVWMRGLACVDGCFVLEVDQPAPATALHATLVGWDRQLGGHSIPVARPCEIRRVEGAWELLAQR